MPYLTQEEYDELESDARYYKSLYESESKAKASIMADGFKAFGNNGLLESWGHQAAALRAKNAKLREALIKAESALTYANWDGAFDDNHTAQDVINARDEARRALESHE